MMIVEQIHAWSAHLTPAQFMLAATIVLVVQFLPSFIAFAREAENRFMILILNLLLGWTGIVWLVLVIWSCTERKRYTRS